MSSDLIADRDGWKRMALQYLAERDDARTDLRHLHTHAMLAMQDLLAIAEDDEDMEVPWQVVAAERARLLEIALPLAEQVVAESNPR